MEEIENKEKPLNRLAGPEGFANKIILITGGTGFLGKVLVEKILRTCPDVKRIYLLIRTKKGKNPQDRVKEMFKSPLYDLLKQTQGEEILSKVIAISSDICELDLDLSKDDRRLLTDEVDLIFHLAATIRFDEPLKKAVLLNTRATKLMLELAKECKNLLLFSHISTAYCHLDEKVLYEKTYPPPADPYKIIKAVETLDEEIINIMTPKILDDCPNTYAFTKGLAEGLVNDEMDNMPVIIIRPSVVLPVWLDPLPGWTDNINGPIGLLIAAGKGIVRTMYCNPDASADFLSVDVAVNAIMLAAFDFLYFKRSQRVYNITSSAEIQVSWGTIIEVGKKLVVNRMPFNWAVWYPGGSPKTSRLYHNVCMFLFHYIPALFLDSLIFISGNKPVLCKIQQRITKGFDIFEYFANNEWDFRNDQSLETRKLLTKTEREIYKVDTVGFDIEEFSYNAMHGARLYVLKEGDETLPTARRHMKIMWAVDKICKGLFWAWFGYFLLRHFVFPVIGMSS